MVKDIIRKGNMTQILCIGYWGTFFSLAFSKESTGKTASDDQNDE